MSKENLQDKVDELKLKGNECVKEKNYAEAAVQYTHAIQLNKNIPQLYSNRSLAFLKMQQYYFALQDANDAIRLDPTWAKGYFRKGEVEFATKHYCEAVESYRLASQLQVDPQLLEFVMKAKQEWTQQRKLEQQTPWVVAGGGLIVGVLLVVADATLANNPIFIHPLIQVLVTMVISCIALLLGRFYKWYVISQRKSLLDPPVDLLEKAAEGAENRSEDDGGGEEGGGEEKKNHHHRYTKAQARQRFKKGKV